MNTDRIKREILESGREIERLRARVKETFSHRDESDSARKAWTEACSDFHKRYMQVSLPGGFDDIEARILAGEPYAVEAALCFLEVRPYFFRSGYMFQTLLRKLKRAPLAENQRLRLDAVVERQTLWRKKKEAAREALTCRSTRTHTCRRQLRRVRWLSVHF